MFVNLLQAKLALNDLSDFPEILKRGKAIHPRYEPLYLLEAKYLYKLGKFDESDQKLNELFEINSRYLPAKQLYEDIQKIMNNKNR